VITAESVNKAEEEIDGLTAEQLDPAIERLLDAQPVVKEYLVGFSNGEVRILELVLVLSFFVFKAYEAEYPGKPPRMKRDDFESIIDVANAWIDQLDSTGMPDPRPEAEPVLLMFIIESLNNPRWDTTRYTAREQRHGLAIVNMVILALNRAARRLKTFN